MNTSIAQDQTVGVFVNEPEAMDAYTFFSPMYIDTAYMIDNCGYRINSWIGANRPGLTGYLLEDGTMLRTNKIPGNNLSQASNGGLLQILDWDGDIIWEYQFADENYTQHHEAHYMPNGNILFLGWEILDEDEQIALGKDPNEVQGDLWGEFIWEIKPIGSDDYELIWEWYLKDHIVQDVNPGLPNYGDISTSFGLVDINYAGPGWWSPEDWWHCNALDYNEDKDEIIINARNNNELWILDHSTTSAEAAQHTGGNKGKGGDLLFRWGNPESYKNGTSSDLKMFGSHGHHWIGEGLPNEGKILYFNNGDARPQGYYSTVDMLEIMEDANGNYILGNDNIYQTDGAVTLYEDSSIDDEGDYTFSSRYLSNAQQLPNGNVFINEGGDGHLFEINPNGEIVWDFVNPASAIGILPHGDVVRYNHIFQAFKIPKDMPGLIGKNLERGELMELDNTYAICDTSVTMTTVIDVIFNSPDHTILEQAIIAAGLSSTLRGIGPFTVFAPTDAAFNELPPGTLATLFADPTGDLKDILLYHVIDSKKLSSDFSDGLEITTLNGKDIEVEIMNGNIFINDAQITIADMETDNGVVHVIDEVLSPETSSSEELEASFNQVNIFPNPTDSYFQVDFEKLNSKITSLRILGLDGKIIRTLDNVNNPIDISDLSQGLYLVQLRSEEMNYVKKLIVR